MQRIWDELTPLPKLGSIAEIHKGVEYNIPLKENENILFSDVPRAGFAKGLRCVTDDFEPYITKASTYLTMDPQLMLYEAYKLPWDKPKVIANAARLSRGHWLIAGAICLSHLCVNIWQLESNGVISQITLSIWSVPPMEL